MLAAGLVLLLLAVGLAEYARRHPLSHEAAVSAGAVSTPLLDTEAAGTDDGAAPPGAWPGWLSSGGGAGPAGFVTVVQGPFSGRLLQGGFGAVLFVADAAGASALVRAAAGEGARLVAARKARVTALYLDGSAAFFAEGGVVLSTGARGDEPVVVRARFTRAVVTSLAAVGDTVYVTLRPKGAPEDSDEATGAVARIEHDGQVALVAGNQVSPRAVAADGKDVLWIAGAPPTLWRSPRGAAYASKVASDAAGPLALDGDGVLYRGAAGGLWRVPRAGGTSTEVVASSVQDFLALSGLTRFTTSGGVFEVTAGEAPRSLLATTSAPAGLALAGTSLYVLTGTASQSTLLAQP
jgi:hypothetical protein